MGKGIKLSILGGILTIVGTYIFTWFSFVFVDTLYASGIGGIINSAEIIPHMGSLGRRYNLEPFEIYLWIIFIYAFAACGALQILAIKNYYIGLVGTIIALIMGIMLFLGAILGVVPFFLRYLELFGSDLIVEGAFPIHYVWFGKASLGCYLVFAGGIIGVIGAYFSREEYF
ncbi:MAG: hypothetical protein ACFFAO_11600 [Candidatus Hermodarchaeota archaeon]